MGITQQVHTVIWQKPEHDASEEAHVVFADERLEAKGIAVSADALPYRLDYSLHTGARFVTERLVVTLRGAGWARQVELERWPDGAWTIDAEQEGMVDLPAPGGDPRAIRRALDVDLGLSPLFNTMPVLRHGLHEHEGSVEFLMAWISVPDLAVAPLRQRYTHIGTDGERGVVRYESLGDDEQVTFTADIVFDADGLVLDYPGIGTRALAPDAEPI